MAVTETLIKNVVQMKLNIGQDAQGNIKTATVGLGSLSGTAWDAQKALNVVAGLIPCLTRTVADVQHVATSSIDED